jgi:hypothetical protein
MKIEKYLNERNLNEGRSINDDDYNELTTAGELIIDAFNHLLLNDIPIKFKGNKFKGDKITFKINKNNIIDIINGFSV